jgi:hypothetical protein
MTAPPRFEPTVAKTAHALLGLAHTLAVRVLPWSGRSQQDAWLAGCAVGYEEGHERGYLKGYEDGRRRGNRERRERP